ncbi:hypothetical protein QR680_002340 [Steinernema hermaphroditum]|uniref:Uncharacterized protein n=1 Tax=Steinernema hermaphroditum TaxID=289476 RepID=A0AA39LHJ0_9BILA|nr:hypothetical protein QR680_002340 [Steinernema hermaphroditum]
MALSAARGVTQVMNRCEDAKSSGFLDLSNCSLMYIADAIYLVLKGHNITKCSLKNNCLKKFPKKMIDRFPGMTIFNMEGNELGEAPDELCTWISMKGINLARNKLTRFPEQLYAMKELSLLDLSGNPIGDLDVETLYTELPLLQQLIMKDLILPAATVELLKTHPKKPQNLVLSM